MEFTSRVPAISVIIPCYNQGHFLHEAVASVLAQTVQDFEILIVDDGSSDSASRRLLKHFERPRTRVFHTANQGLAAARNFLIAKARGRFLCALDADDKLHPEFFAKALAAFERDPGLTFVSSWLEAFGSEQWLWRQERCDLATLLAEDTVMTAALVSREAVVAAGGYAEDMPAPGYEDWDLWIRLVKAGHRGTILPEVLFYYRRHAGAMSHIYLEGETHLELMRYLTRKHAETYRPHLDGIVLARERELADLHAIYRELERELETWLEPRLELRRRDLEELQERLDGLEDAGGGEVPERIAPPASDEVRELRIALDAARHEARALRESMSWKVTAPLRAVYDVLRRFAGADHGPSSGASPALAEAPSGTMPDGDEFAPLLEKEREVAAQRRRERRLVARRREAAAELARLETEIARDRLRLREHGLEPFDWGDLRHLRPLSPLWGLDRGMPLDRYYIEAFLERHRGDIHGRVLEIKDDGYTRLFGEDVETSDVLDVDPENRRATVVADLTRADAVADGIYDCFILTQTLNVIYDARAALGHAWRVLKSGGVLLVTVSALNRVSHEDGGLDGGDYWRFTEAALVELCAEVAPRDACAVTGYGNVLVCAAFLYGLARHELTTEELDLCDPYFPLIYGVRLVKPGSREQG